MALPQASTAALASVSRESQMPSKVYSVVVVGEAAGVATARALTESGIRFCPCKQIHMAGERFFKNRGRVRQLGRGPAEMSLPVRSLRARRSFECRYQIESGFRCSGICCLWNSSGYEERVVCWAENADAVDLEQHVQDGNGVARLVPALPKGFSPDNCTASGGRAEPPHAVPALARRARDFGEVRLRECWWPCRQAEKRCSLLRCLSPCREWGCPVGKRQNDEY